ncbi:L-rhamnose-binding lectin CSL3-like, partial [Stylophora pistillata]|uniref:L-rhamnose-binding lectin CSL3-like n=1 Tax=Stylophora pistillata TaxID=50429 RepID=UPI000C051FB7
TNECTSGTHDCDANAECNNTLGSYNCTCKDGFHGNGTRCTDLDECASGTHGCDVNAECNNILGSYNCTCIYGFNGNGTNCTEKVWSITICERKPNRIISCENERKIDAVYANFGRLDRVTCVHGVMSNTNCRAVNSLSTVQTKCNGKVSCELAATNSDFGDPCAGTYKYLEVKFKCVL